MYYTYKDIEALERVISFLLENEQYGDDWETEINILQRVIDNLRKVALPINPSPELGL